MTGGNNRRELSGKPGECPDSGNFDYSLRLFDDFPNPIWRADLNAECNYFNREWLAFTGRTLEEELGNGWTAGIHPDDFGQCQKTGLDAFGRREPFEREYRLRYHDGTYRWLHDCGKPYYHPDGTFAGYLGSCYDINARREAEIALKESEKRYRDMFEINNAVMFMVDPVSRQIVDANAAACRYYGYSREEMQHLLITQINIQDPEKTQQDMNSAAASPGAVFRFRHKKKDGEIRNVEVFSGTVYFGGRRLLHSIIQDVTERTRAEEALRESREQYRALVENLNDVIISLDREGTFTYVSPAVRRLYGYSPDDLIGQQFLHFIHPDDRNHVAGVFGQELSGVYQADEFRILARDGPVRFISVSPRPIMHDGSIAGFNYVMTDITERKKAEMEERLTRERFETLVKVAEMRDASDKELAEFVMRAATRMTGSTLAFTGTMTPDESAMDIVAWSETATKECGVAVSPFHFPIREAGIWAEAVRTRGPVIVNDYSLPHPHRKGLPEGHVGILRFLSLPVIDNGKVVMVAAVANKTDPYDDADVTRLSLLMQGIWGYLQKRHAEDALRESRQLLEAVLNSITVRVFWKDTNLVLLGCNTAFARDAGYENPKDVIGKDDFALAWREQAERYRADDRAVLGTGKEKILFEEPQTSPSGELKYLLTSKVPLRDAGGNVIGVLGTYLDITERKEAEALLQDFNRQLEAQVRVQTGKINASLNEKVVLLREIHHRVKNNLQLIISLTNLQMRQIDDERLVQVMKETQNRVRAMALVHEKLYQSEDIARINLADYTRFLATQIFAFYGINARRVKLNFDIGRIMLDINTAIPTGLILNELVSNALKHAFPDTTTGELSVAAREEGNTIFLTVRDTGVGMPPGFDWKTSQSLGLHLVQILTEQLRGTVELEPSPKGTTFSLRLTKVQQDQENLRR